MQKSFFRANENFLFLDFFLFSMALSVGGVRTLMFPAKQADNIFLWWGKTYCQVTLYPVSLWHTGDTRILIDSKCTFISLWFVSNFIGRSRFCD